MQKVFSTGSGKSYLYDGISNIIYTLPRQFQENDCIPDHLAAQFGQGKIRDALDIRWLHGFQEYEYILENKLPVLVLEITKNCNLCCKYCRTHAAPFQNADMSEETMLRSIDFFESHSKELEHVRIHFYGGEPFLHFDLIKKAMLYAQLHLLNRKVIFSISTNGLQLNPNTAEWLADHPDVKLAITVNGPFHDQYRRKVTGNGSLEEIMSNLLYLKSHYPDFWDKQVDLISNLDCEGEVPDLLRFCGQKLGKMPSSVTPIIWKPVSAGSLPDREELAVPLVKCSDESEDEYLKQYYIRSIWKIHNRGLAKDHISYTHSCFPGEIKLFVSYDGHYGFCERTEPFVSIGSVDQGFDKQGLQEIYDNLLELTVNSCSVCWCQRLCNICLAKLFDSEGHMLKSPPSELCEAEKRMALRLLARYCEIAEVSPELLK